MAGLLEGKRILVTGIITDSSIAFHIAKVAQEQGAELVLTGFDRLRLIERITQRLPKPARCWSSTCRTRSTWAAWLGAFPR
ncbi:enoyl-(Acyl carrier) reductase family protein [Mycobacteroides abscessus 1948]|uniref:Enoyl-(Acyl carrier ) reductase family protein n=1 Tax=Mycobacteroides abscessus 1948 TaxID=1299323 RepID=A0A829QF10_9MYCO|nr:enoyl-(Acyl carrier) reductase family protein [Mycobacteroides abscessus 1948]